MFRRPRRTTAAGPAPSVGDPSSGPRPGPGRGDAGDPSGGSVPNDIGDGGEPKLADYATALADGIEAALPAWVTGSVTRLMTAWAGAVSPEVRAAADEAGRRCQAETGAAVRALLQADIDAQQGTPLALLRAAVRYPTEVLVGAGVPDVVRDAFAEQVFPDDPYNLAPASLADVAPALTELGIAWGAAKAFEHMHRHRS